MNVCQYRYNSGKYQHPRPLFHYNDYIAPLAGFVAAQFYVGHVRYKHYTLPHRTLQCHYTHHSQQFRFSGVHLTYFDNSVHSTKVFLAMVRRLSVDALSNRSCHHGHRGMNNHRLLYTSFVSSHPLYPPIIVRRRLHRRLYRMTNPPPKAILPDRHSVMRDEQRRTFGTSYSFAP